MSKQGDVSTPVRFLLSGTSGCMSTCIVHPMDLVKSRMQVSGEGSRTREYKTSLHLLKAVVKNEGVLGAYAGLTAGWFRQATYCTTRLGIYTIMFSRLSSQTQDGTVTPPAFYQQILIASAAGSAAGVAGTPAELCLVRMTVDGRLPPAQRRNYRNAIHALWRIVADEGRLAIFRGMWATVVRSAVTNAAELASYSQAKQLLLTSGYFKDNVGTHFAAGMASGLVTSFASLPFDLVKTRIQDMRIQDNGMPKYRGIADVFVRVVRTEGVAALWKGFTPYYMRVGPHIVFTFIFFEELSRLYAKYILGQEKRRAL